MTDRELIETEADHILAATSKAGLTLRLTGSIAVQRRCPQYGFIASRNRIYRDIDFAGRAREAREVQNLLTRLGYVEDREVFVVSEGTRSIFERPSGALHVDVFYDKLDFCHVIHLDGRLEADMPTLPLAELLLGKLQIVKISEKDIADATALLLEHPLGESDSEAVNVGRIADLCAQEWGLWRTVTMNLDKIRRFAGDHPHLDEAQRAQVIRQAHALQARLAAEPKPLAWRLRARLGDRVKWYKEVEEVR
jgi:hypothetical protein